MKSANRAARYKIRTAVISCVFNFREIDKMVAEIAGVMAPDANNEHKPFLEAVANWNWEHCPKLTDFDIDVLTLALKGDNDDENNGGCGEDADL